MSEATSTLKIEGLTVARGGHDRAARDLARDPPGRR